MALAATSPTMLGCRTGEDAGPRQDARGRAVCLKTRTRSRATWSPVRAASLSRTTRRPAEVGLDLGDPGVDQDQGPLGTRDRVN